MAVNRKITSALAAIVAMVAVVLMGGAPALAQGKPATPQGADYVTVHHADGFAYYSVDQRNEGKSSLSRAGLQCFDQINHNILNAYVGTYYGGNYNTVCNQCNERAVEGVQAGAWGAFGCWITARNQGYIIELWVAA